MTRNRVDMTSCYLGVLLIVCGAVPVHAATHWRCMLEGEVEPEWIRIDANGDWREWRGLEWGESSCVGHKAYSCRHSDGIFYAETFSKVPDTRGTLRVVDRLDSRSGRFHRRVLDSTFILETGAQIEKNFYGHCEAGGEPDKVSSAS